MCPKSEMAEHSTSCSPFEKDASGRFSRDLAVKTFHRSDAGQIIQEDDVRPLPVLKQTVSHILNVVIGEMTGKSAETCEMNMYLYVRDRFRAIRQDITVQGLHGAEVIEIYETIALFFIWAGLRFFRFNVSDFDPVQNSEQITQTLLSLDEQYDVTPHTSHEVLFRALHLLVAVGSTSFLSKVIVFSKEMVQAKYIQQVLMLRKAIVQNDVAGYWCALGAMPVQMAVFALQNSKKLWEDAGRAMRKGFGRRPFSIAMITEFLKLPVQDLEKWNEAFKFLNENGLVRADMANKVLDLSLLPRVMALDDFVSSRYMENFLLFRELQESDMTSSIPEPVSIEPEPEEDTQNEKPQEVSSPEVSPEPAVEPEPVSFFREEPEVTPPVNEEPVPVIRAPSPEPAPIIKIVTLKKPPTAINRVSLEAQPITERELSAMIPPNIPTCACATVLIVADDESESSLFARKRFDWTTTTLFCDTFAWRNSTLHLLLTSDRTCPHVGAVLYCNETGVPPPRSTHFCVRSGYSELLSFNDCLRRSILSSLREIVPIDLSELLQTCLRRAHQCLSNSNWRWATANSVIYVMNEALASFASHGTSPEFQRFLLPLEHNLLHPDDLQQFLRSLRALRLQPLPELQSNHPPQGTTWPYMIHDGTTIALSSFIVPMTSDFSPQDFISLVLSEVPTHAPSETIPQPYRPPVTEAL